MVTTYSGIAVVTGTNDTGRDGIFESVYFDYVQHFTSDLSDPLTITGGVNTFILDPMSAAHVGVDKLIDPVSFNYISHFVEQPFEPLNTITSVFILDPRSDMSILPTTTGRGISVVEWGTNTNTTFIATSRVNFRVFPTPVSTATLFPGDRPRGTPLN